MLLRHFKHRSDPDPMIWLVWFPPHASACTTSTEVFNRLKHVLKTRNTRQ